MKKIILIIAALTIVSLPLHTFSQNTTDALFEKYGAKDGFTTVHITKELFSLFGEMTQDVEGEDVQGLNEVIDGLEYIRILMYENSGDNKYADSGTLKAFKEDLEEVKLKNFTELMTVREQDETVKFMIRKEGKIIRELLLLISQDNEAGFISITGNINLKSIAKISKSMDIKGLEQLQKIDEGDE
ncbi:MAG: hypothetical protein B6D64_02330 [Bacteroidetes bacterium 4484_276]|nr:MAG: hypothetical protein B6D64_02330 [Bacteroidetes bacterium 4484_276]OYT13632.1 MAG: hypothetical protein B6I19_04055 [Bacteroidetes bacterium 4572_114]